MRRLRVLYEDDHILIVDKPAGVLTQPTPERERDTLLERAGRYLTRSRGVKAAVCGHRAPDRPGHLGGGLAGVFARGPAAVSIAVSRALDRAIVRRGRRGGHRACARHDRPALGRRPRGRAQGDVTPRRRGIAGDHALRIGRAIRRDGRAARRAGSKPAGRIRSGSTWRRSGHPVVGEPVYRSKTAPPFPVPFPRQALHAQALGFVHPMTGQAMRIEAPLPDDLADLIAVAAGPLRRTAGRARSGVGDGRFNRNAANGEWTERSRASRWIRPNRLLRG